MVHYLVRQNERRMSSGDKVSFRIRPDDKVPVITAPASPLLRKVSASEPAPTLEDRRS